MKLDWQVLATITDANGTLHREHDEYLAHTYDEANDRVDTLIKSLRRKHVNVSGIPVDAIAQKTRHYSRIQKGEWR